MIKDKSVIAIIPARSGSKSIKDKNLADLDGYPLIAYSIAAAKLCPEIDKVIISTDSEEYAEISKKYGAEAPFLRPTELSTDTATDKDFMIHAMEWAKNNLDELPEYWVHLRPTTPLREPKFLSKAIEDIQGDNKSTALRSAHLCTESPFKWFRKLPSGYLCSLISEEDTMLDRFNLPRQSFPSVYIPDGYVDIVRASYIMNTGNFHGDKVIGFESPFCTEVDSMEELEQLEFQIKKSGSVLKNYLKGCK